MVLVQKYYIIVSCGLKISNNELRLLTVVVTNEQNEYL